jgi:signal transduction histidine kinase
MEKQKMIYDYQDKLIRVRIEEQENAKNQISKELHDNVGQLLGLAQMNMHSVLDNKQYGNYRTTRMIKDTLNLIDRTAYFLHNISHTLNSDYISKLGIIEMLRKELDFIHISRGIRCIVNIEGNSRSIAAETEVLIYRIVQELLHNIIKHARASEITITLVYTNDQFTIRIADNGVGFDVNKVRTTGGIGFINMYQRADLMKGRLDIQSAVGKGSTATLTIDGSHYEQPAYPDTDY